MIPIPHLKPLLLKAVRGTVNTTELTQLIHLSRSLAEAYLQHHRTSIIHICSFHGITVSDLATDCVAELFARDERGQSTHLKDLSASLDLPLDLASDLDVFLVYKTFVVKIVAAQLARVYAQIDPAGAKIHRNIKDALRQSQTFTLHQDFRGYVLSPSSADSLDHLENFPLGLLERELAAQASASSEIPALLNALCAILMRQNQYRRSIPLIDLVQTIKRIFSRFAEIEEYEETNIDLSALHNADLLPLQREVLYSVNEKIISTYLLKRKINREEAQALSQVMHSIITEWFEQGPNQDSYYSHTRLIRPMPEEEYNAAWRKRIEYLTRIARETIKNYFDENL